jgi:predicted XRE-type DNA-binding protein
MSDCKAKDRISPPPIHKGENQHLAYLSDDVIEEIRGFLKFSKMPQKEIAKLYGTTPTLISRIATNQTRKVQQ